VQCPIPGTIAVLVPVSKYERSVTSPDISPLVKERGDLHTIVIANKGPRDEKV
jgi:hypothetical protein